MTTEPYFDRDSEWLQLAQPVGLVVSTVALKESGLVATRQSSVDTAAVSEVIADDTERPALADPWVFFSGVLGWRAQDIAGLPGGQPIPNDLRISLPDLGTTLEPTWAVRAPKGVESGSTHQFLVRIEAQGIAPDAKKGLDGWEATPQQRFERLLRESKVHAGLLITDEEIRLVYAPQGETSGWQAFPIRALTSVPGRPILGGVKLLLGRERFFGEPSQRLPQLLHRSREAQASVSTELSAQVLGALHEMQRGMLAAEKRAKGSLLSDLARTNSHHLYEGLLTVLMRLVFVLYAEDRDLIPSKTDKEARWLYDQGYSVRGLFARLSEDEALNPDTMDERVGGWGQLLALFRLIHKGHGSGFIRARGGKLFDPDAFLFLEGRRKNDDSPVVMSVSDGCLLRILRGLMLLRGERLSYRALDVEAIGSVYETVMGFTVETTKGANVAIKAGKNNKVPVFVDLDALLPLKAADRIKRIKEDTGRALSGKTETQVKAAKTVAELLAALDSTIDERGSPERRPVPAGTPVLQPTDERRRTGSHYTPRSLTEPIVRHALEPTFTQLGLDAAPSAILNLKVCDPAMGSGAFLVEACRQLGARLQQAWAKHPAARPKIPDDEDEVLHAKRLVAQRCLYGVDKNPMAVDLAKLSLWLATLARDHEFEFVDHALKTGDSLVGLTNAQISAATWKQDAPANTLFTPIVRERVKEALLARKEIRDAPDDVFRAVQEARYQTSESRIGIVRTIGDAIVSSFFAASKDKAREQERVIIEMHLMGSMEINGDAVRTAAARLRQGEHPIRPFHWELEFPEVFDGKEPGFDAIVGNPPFAGVTSLAEGSSEVYTAFLRHVHPGSGGKCDLIAYFFRRAFQLVKHNAAYGLIATKTIAQGDTRESGLQAILTSGGTIYRAVRRVVWPGEAAVVVSFVHVAKSKTRPATLDGKVVSRISAYLVEGTLDRKPERLVVNKGRAFLGAKVVGMGFTFGANPKPDTLASSLSELKALRAADARNISRIQPYLGGEDLLNDPGLCAMRFAINLDGLPEPEARNGWPTLMAHIERRVKPERDAKQKQGSRLREYWWHYGRSARQLWPAIRGQSRVIATNSGATPHFALAMVPNGQLFANSLTIFAFEMLGPLCCLQSRPHEMWTRFFASSMKDDLRYTPSDCFATFPFPPNFESDPTLEAAGQAYHDHRAALMVAKNEGLTKTYNRFHNPADDHPEIVKLRELHGTMDRAVLTAYGWTDLAARIATDPDAKPRHLTEEAEDDHKYQGRYFWPAPIRDEVLARLLALNAERAEEERLVGLAPALALDDDDGENTEATDGSD